jgi:hypothetical protein
MELGGLRHSQAVLPPGMARCLFCKRPGGTQDRTGRVRKILALTEFHPRTVQAVANRCTE